MLVMLNLAGRIFAQFRGYGIRIKHMSGRQKKKKKKAPPLDDQKRKDDELVADTASVFTCASNTARDFNEQCIDGKEGVEIDLVFNRLAHALWLDKPGIEALATALDLYAKERQRHLDALTELGVRFAALTNDPNLTHQHLDPPEAYYDFIRQRIIID
jgi:hypothetical protein